MDAEQIAALIRLAHRVGADLEKHRAPLDSELWMLASGILYLTEENDRVKKEMFELRRRMDWLPKIGVAIRILQDVEVMIEPVMKDLWPDEDGSK